MAKRLLNVRLGPEDEQLAKRLRARGISISDVVRRALRAEAKQLDADGPDAENVLREMFAQYPTPAAPPPPRVDARDRRAVREHVKQKLRART